MNPTLPPFVQELLDRGVDPLDDPRTQEWLLAHPETLPSFAALRRTLAELPARARPALPWRPVAWLSAAAAAAMASFGLLAAGDGAADRPLPRPDFAASSSVVHSRAAVTEVEGTSSRHSAFVLARGGLAQRRLTLQLANRPAGTLTPGVSVRAVTTVEEALIP